MAADDLHGFDADGAARIARTVRASEAAGRLGASSAAARNNARQVITAKLTSRDGTDPTLYAWTQARRNAAGDWELVAPLPLTGTTTDRPAVAMDEDAGDLTDKFVQLSRGSYHKGDGTRAPCWHILAGGGSTLELKFGVMVGTWDPGENSVVLTPCASHASSAPTGEGNVSAYIQFPFNLPAPCFGGYAGQILAYLSFGPINVLVGAPMIPRATAKFQVLSNQADTGASDYQPDWVRGRGPA